MIKLTYGIYNKVPILYTKYIVIKRKERGITYRLAVKKNGEWYALFPWYAPFHRWTWNDLCNCFGYNNLEIDEKAIEAYHYNENIEEKIVNKIYKDDFKFHTKPYNYQFDDFIRLIHWDRIPLFIACGLGKSKIVLDAIRHNHLRALYICPAPLVGNMIQEAQIHSQDETQVFRLDVKWFQQMKKDLDFTHKDFKTDKKNPVPKWLDKKELVDKYVQEQLASLDGSRSTLFLSTYSMLTAYPDIIHDYFNYDTFVADESHKIKTHTSQRTIAAVKVASKTRKRILMSGTASLGTPLDLYPQYLVMDELILGNNYYKFFNKYCIPNADYRTKADGFQNLDSLNRKIQPITIVQTKEECLPDLPERTQIITMCELSDEEKNAYKKMSSIDWSRSDGDVFGFRDKSLWIKQGSIKMLKMKQISGGFINMAQPNYELCNTCEHVRECTRDDISPNTKECKVDPTPLVPDIEYMKAPGKIKVMRELVENSLSGTKEKMLIFAHFTAELDLIEKNAKDLGIEVYRVDGKTKDVNAVSQEAARCSDPAVLVSQISCGVGWNFVVANKVIYYSLDLQYESFAQSRDRVKRIGQKFNITEWHLHNKHTLDGMVKNLIDDKGHIADTLLSKDCSKCVYVNKCSALKWSDDCIYAREYKRPTITLRFQERAIHKLAKKLV